MQSEHRKRLRRKFKNWLETVSDQISGLLFDNNLFWQSMDRIHHSGNIEPNNNFYRWMARAHLSHIAMWIRRLIDKNEGTYSLRALLLKMSKNPQVISKPSCCWSSNASLHDMRRQWWDSAFGPKEKFIPCGYLRQDLAKLKQIEDQLIPQIHKQIAHYDQNQQNVPTPQWDDYNQAIQTLEDICLRYRLILLGTGSITLLPASSTLFQDLNTVWGAAAPSN